MRQKRKHRPQVRVILTTNVLTVVAIDGGYRRWLSTVAIDDDVFASDLTGRA